MRIKNIYVLLGLCLSAGSLWAQKTIILKSPSKAISIQVNQAADRLTYEVSAQNEQILKPSRLLWTVDGKELGRRVESITATKAKSHRTSYDFIGNHSKAQNAYRELTLNIRETSGETYQIDLRAYNTGVAFRYRYANGTRERKVNDLTEFVLPTGNPCWLQSNPRYYENAYKKYDTGGLPDGVVAGPPVTIKYGTPGLYASITEGGLVNFGGMALKVAAPDKFESRLEGETLLSGDIATPWRVVMIGDLNSLVNNDIVTDVSEPLSPVFGGKLDWIKPGNCVWSWLTGYGVTLENMKRFTDWAAELGIPYNLVDEGWSHWEDKANGKTADDMIKELVDYSAKKGVKILLWKAYPDCKGIEGIQTPEKRARFFAKCKAWGVAGVKIDFFDCESQTITRYYEETLKDAAKYGLMINFHGSNKPTGLNRTYPNEVAREGIMGQEYGRSIAAQDNITPYTRYLAGHADYTPMTFIKGRMGNTTEAHQIAVTAIFLSPLRCYGGRPEDYVKHPARELFLSVPNAWDETIVLPPSEIGDCVVMAHRKGNDWFIAAVTEQAKQGIRVPLSFLGKGTFEGTMVADAPTAADNKACAVSRKSYTRKDVLTFDMEAGGGFLIRLTNK